MSTGSAYTFTYTQGSWQLKAKLNASDGAATDYFGTSVSISDNISIIGAYLDDDNGSSSGSAYIHTLTP